MLKEKIDILTLLFSKPDGFIKDRIIEGNMGEMLETAFPNFKWELTSFISINSLILGGLIALLIVLL